MITTLLAMATLNASPLSVEYDRFNNTTSISTHLEDDGGAETLSLLSTFNGKVPKGSPKVWIMAAGECGYVTFLVDEKRIRTTPTPRRKVAESRD